MSLRIKLIIALLSTSLVSVAVMWAVAYERLDRRFGTIVQTASARNFRGDIAAYWLTYGSLEAAARAEPLTQFIGRRRGILAARGIFGDTGDVDAAEAIPPYRPGMSGVGPGGGPGGGARGGPGGGPGAGPGGDRPPPRGDGQRPPPPGGPEGGEGGGFRPIFRFTLFDPDGFVLNARTAETPPSERVKASAEDRAKAVPIIVKGQTIAYLSVAGEANYTATDRAYLAATQNALAWGIGAAGIMALVMGLLAGRYLTRSLRPLTLALANMGDGAIRQQVPVTSRDEIGALAQAFNQMSEDLAKSHAELHESHRRISEQAQQLYEASIRDALTGLYNRRYFDETVTRIATETAANAAPLSLAITDIDFFKRINDHYSHATGDAVLRIIGKILRAETREEDIVARYGGEEFTLAFPNTDLPTAVSLCERLRRSVEAYPWETVATTLRVTLSLGVAAHENGVTPEETLKVADQRLYWAKGNGRNRVCDREDLSRESVATLA
jgi:diguanylate cyclase (GGDEF)-like protein